MRLHPMVELADDRSDFRGYTAPRKQSPQEVTIDGVLRVLQREIFPAATTSSCNVRTTNTMSVVERWGRKPQYYLGSMPFPSQSHCDGRWQFCGVPYLRAPRGQVAALCSILLLMHDLDGGVSTAAPPHLPSRSQQQCDGARTQWWGTRGGLSLAAQAVVFRSHRLSLAIVRTASATSVTVGSPPSSPDVVHFLRLSAMLEYVLTEFVLSNSSKILTHRARTNPAFHSNISPSPLMYYALADSLHPSYIFCFRCL